MMAEEPEDDLRGHDWTGTPMESFGGLKRRRLIVTGVAVACAVIVIIIAVASSGNKNSSGSKKTPGAGEQVTLTNDELQALHSIIEGALTEKDISTDDLLTSDSYQYKAFDWLSTNAQLNVYDDSQKIQRFSLACFYYATYQVPTKYTPTPDPWFQSEGWLTDAPECDWAGIHCNSEGQVHSIALEKNKLAGALPAELALMSDTLRGLDLTSNALFMKGKHLDVFRQLPNLEKIALDDNYVHSKDGIPSALENLTDLKKLVLSYNLLEGSFDNGVLNNLTKLTHLEIESNYLTGKTPVLGELPLLEYIYLRSNSLSAHLNFLKTGKLTNLVSIWLDGNDISKTIPTEIGSLKNISSFSCANAQLTGTIPTEFGLLTNLRRLWLFNNSLSGHIPSELEMLDQLEVFKVEDNPHLKGHMPGGLCDIIEQADYEHKALTTDCDRVTCDCCTEC